MKNIYKIKASELTDITNEDIKLYLYESNKINEKRNIEEVYSFSENVDIIDKSVLPVSDINWYKLKFKQKDGADFKISNAKVRYTNENTGRVEDVIDLIHPQTGFILNAEGEFVSSHNQKIIRRVEDLTVNSGLKNLENGGLTIADNNFEGTGIFSINNYAGMYLTIDHSCAQVDVPKHLIQAKGTYWNDNNEFVIRGDYSIEDKKVIIELEANTFEFRCVNSKITGRCTVTIEENGQSNSIVLEPDNKTGTRNKIAIEETEAPRKIKITIETLSFNDVILADFKYSNYVMNIGTEIGKLEYIADNKYRLPNNKNNNLIISLVSTTGQKPIIKKILIGYSINDISYTTDYIESKSFCSRKFDIKTTAEISLMKISAVNQDIITNVAIESEDLLINIVQSLFKDDVKTFLNNRLDRLFRGDDNRPHDYLLEMKEEKVASVCN